MSDWDEIDQFYSSLDGQLGETGRQMSLLVRKLRQSLPSDCVPFTSLVMFGLRIPDGDWYPAAEWKGDGAFEVCLRNWKTFRQKSLRREPMDDAVSSFIELAASLQPPVVPSAASPSAIRKRRTVTKKPSAKNRGSSEQRQM